MDSKTKSQCLTNAVEIVKQAAVNTSYIDIPVLLENTYKKLVELAEDVQKQG